MSVKIPADFASIFWSYIWNMDFYFSTHSGILCSSWELKRTKAVWRTLYECSWPRNKEQVRRKKLLPCHYLIQEIEIRCKLCLLYLKQTIHALICSQCWLTSNYFSRSLIDKGGHRAELKSNASCTISPVSSLYENLWLVRLLTFHVSV